MVSFCDVEQEDETFLIELFMDTRKEDFMMLELADSQLEFLLQQQFDLQQQSYLNQYPVYEHVLILHNNKRVGQLRTANLEHYIQIIDISVCSAYQNKGIGTLAIRHLQQQARQQNKSIYLNVIENSRAKPLYEKLGFKVEAKRSPYMLMSWDINCSNDMSVKVGGHAYIKKN